MHPTPVDLVPSSWPRRRPLRQSESARSVLGCLLPLFALLAGVVILIVVATMMFPSFSGMAGGAPNGSGSLPSAGNAASNPAHPNGNTYTTGSEMRGYQDRLDVQRLDAVLAAKGSALAGHAAEIDAVAKQYNLDPVVFASMIMEESGWGSNRATRDFNNITSIMTGPNASQFRQFATLQDSMSYTANMLVNGNYYFTQGRTTLDAVGAVYAPVGASNDPKNTNGGWASDIVSIANSTMPTKPVQNPGGSPTPGG